MITALRQTLPTAIVGAWAATRRHGAALAAVLLLIVFVGISPNFGASWDERFHQKYAEEIWDYFSGLRPRSAFDTDFGNQYLYGGFFEFLCAAAQHLFPLDPYVVRHGVNSAVGWAGVVFAFLIGSRAFGAKAGWLAAALLAVMPRYIGHSMNNPKDLPFAVLALATIYLVLTFSRHYPHVSLGNAAKLTLAIALAIGVRPMGIMLLAYAAGGLMLVAIASAERSVSRLGATVLRLSAIAILAVLGGTLFWPWAQGQPLIRPFEAFFIASGYDWGNPSLFAGRDIPARQLPWHYLPTWLLIGLPPVVVTGAGLSLLRLRNRAGERVALAGLWGFVLVPAGLVILRGVTMYDSFRHMLFIVAPVAVLAAAGWEYVLARAGRARLLAAAVLAIGVAEPIVFQIRNHPHQGVYFTPLIGGPRGAFGRFDMDYWGNSVLQAVEWSAREAERAQMPIGVSGSAWEVVLADADRFKRLYFRLPYRSGYHFYIHLLKGTRQDVLDASQRGDILHRVTTADGTPLCVVIPGPEYPRFQERLAGRGPR
jgi:4-amino-4-deoxy-L-arabinose transferase-like glycosyltransferase